MENKNDISILKKRTEVEGRRHNQHRFDWPCILFSFLCTELFPVFICDQTLRFSNSLFPFGLFVCLYLLLRDDKLQKYGLRIKCYTYVLGFLFSSMTAFGYTLEYQESIDFRDVSLLLAVTCYAYIISALLRLLWTISDRWQSEKQPRSRTTGQIKLLERPWLVMIILLILWMPCYISAFPGGFRYDATAEFNQIVKGFSGDFPLLHSVLTTKLLTWGYELTESYNTGIAIYTLAQMLLAAALFTRILCVMKEICVPRAIVCILLIYYAVFPVIPMLVTCTVRDVLFGLLLTYLVFLMFSLGMKGVVFVRSRAKMVELAVVLVLTLLSRNNNAGMAVPALLIGLCVIISVLIKKQKGNLKTVMLFNLAVFSIYFLITCSLSTICQPFYPARTNSALSLFSQSIVRAYLADGDSWSEEEKNKFEQFVSTDNLEYVPENGDSTKWDLKIEDGEFGEFLNFWLKM